MIYLNEFILPDPDVEMDAFSKDRRTCFNTYYPFYIFPKMEFRFIEFHNVTIFYGGNGTGKTTLLNIITEKLKLTRKQILTGQTFLMIT